MAKRANNQFKLVCFFKIIKNIYKILCKRMGIRDSGVGLLCKLLTPFLNLTKLILDLQKNDLTDKSMFELGNVLTGFQLLEEIEINCFWFCNCSINKLSYF